MVQRTEVLDDASESFPKGWSHCIRHGIRFRSLLRDTTYSFMPQRNIRHHIRLRALKTGPFAVRTLPYSSRISRQFWETVDLLTNSHK